MSDDLNTAEALAAIFDMVREVNAAADAGEVKQADIPPLFAVMQQFDQIFDVLQDTDAPKIARIVEWAKEEGKAAAAKIETAPQLSDQQVEELMSKREAARRARDFKTSDAIRAQLADAGVIVEDTKDGARWKRK
jgi:cysteinyl-tRNA synthetase